MKHLYKCASCGKYTMKEICACGNKTMLSKGIKYTPGDKFASYKRQAKMEEYKIRGVI